jgi:hypothetical protein
MQLLSVGVARSVWLFDIKELNPAGKNIFPDILMWAGGRYSFKSFPKSVNEVDEKTKGFVFKTGEFQAKDDVITVNVSLFTDGLVAESWASTEKTDAFLEDLLQSAASRYGLVYGPSTIRTKWYVSEITVHFDCPLSNAVPHIMPVCNIMTEVFKRHGLPPFEFTGMLFAPDTSATSYKPPSFAIERKVGAAFSENRFWSRSPFTTEDHLRVLGEFEQMLASS